MTKTPKIKASIVCVTYNQESYIRETIDSFLMQKLNDIYQIVISDDCSTDSTRDIILEYAQKYPDIFKINLQDSNVGVARNFKDALMLADGEYIALCEGDDFWIDETKLQRQVDFLDNHKNYSLCFHPVRVFFENGEEKDSVHPLQTDAKVFTLQNLLKENFIQTNSVMYRRRDYSHIPTNILPIDWYLHLYHAETGSIGFINRVMSAYRRHPNGIWWNAYSDIEKIWSKYGEPHLALYSEILKIYPGYSEQVVANISTALEGVVTADTKHTLDIITVVKKMFNSHLSEMLILELEKGVAYRKELEKRDAALSHQAQEIVDLKATNTLLNSELVKMKSSRSWKATTIMHSVLYGIQHPIKVTRKFIAKRLG